MEPVLKLTIEGEKMNSLINKADVLVEALPYIQRLSGKTVVIKYGGNAMTDPALSYAVMQDITLLKYVGVNPVLVHGGGPEINKMLTALNIKSQFHQGLRITDNGTINVVEMVLTGKVNKDIVTQLNLLGGNAIGLSGKDGNLIEAKKIKSPDGVDLGYVGEVTNINCKVLDLLAKDEYIPVVAPIGIGENGATYNINADTVAGQVAAALKAEKLIFLTDTDGVLRNPQDPSSIISVLSVDEINNLIDSGIISDGMIPKVQSCVQAIERGVRRTHIINGTIKHPLLLEIFTDRGIGTMVVAK